MNRCRRGPNVARYRQVPSIILSARFRHWRLSTCILVRFRWIADNIKTKMLNFLEIKKIHFYFRNTCLSVG